ncbi:hypothetical protein AVEN_178597-1 [Araneus ventricosus]|uniref:Uncharacterized protein n=1 Tax=Araneus ventricosus TaxID=182803 RepID=A0A4Y2WPR2_ARAVE|nr:hypothetical protein AVEN_178597-1 [Araneus ventricosus]
MYLNGLFRSSSIGSFIAKSCWLHASVHIRPCQRAAFPGDTRGNTSVACLGRTLEKSITNRCDRDRYKTVMKVAIVLRSARIKHEPMIRRTLFDGIDASPIMTFMSPFRQMDQVKAFGTTRASINLEH